jgi:hypothetical protein
MKSLPEALKHYKAKPSHQGFGRTDETHPIGVSYGSRSPWAAAAGPQSSFRFCRGVDPPPALLPGVFSKSAGA